jgi:hypothetical protein
MGEEDASAAIGRGWGLRAPSAQHSASKAKGPIQAQFSRDFSMRSVKRYRGCMRVVGCGIRRWITSKFKQVRGFRV